MPNLSRSTVLFLLSFSKFTSLPIYLHSHKSLRVIKQLYFTGLYNIVLVRYCFI